jgi:hypothetical protein
LNFNQKDVRKQGMKNLSFIDDFKTRVLFGVVLYRGKNLLKFKENIFLVPYELFF